MIYYTLSRVKLKDLITNYTRFVREIGALGVKPKEDFCLTSSLLIISEA